MRWDPMNATLMILQLMDAAMGLIVFVSLSVAGIGQLWKGE